ncbi:uncharacterized protein E0L32_004224 [Thyridium curvatum]|uniref:Uncharacterized protein n=1 Tax=Thyridium curvatum TaxID=1093900 RepID=A0A507BG00_9PEZI|nr:uncharacterized protein E0L32_004224 [Thyridium curvatum]TPX16229.1 hypothetical protein E0L32_004224 [Thyridium curvatum]
MADYPPEQEEQLEASSPPPVFTQPYTISLDFARQIQRGLHDDVHRTVESQADRVIEELQKTMVDMKEAIVEDLEQRNAEQVHEQLNEMYGDHIKKHFGRVENKQATMHDLQTASHNEVLQAHRHSASAARGVDRLLQQKEDSPWVPVIAIGLLIAFLIALLVVLVIVALMAMMLGVRVGPIPDTVRGLLP